nr:MAG TPA: hypothetical protein [Caudoviricetes sp.]
MAASKVAATVFPAYAGMIPCEAPSLRATTGTFT